MADVEQATAGLTGNEATIAAMADVLAAVGGGAGIMEWADEAPAEPASPGQPVAATGATIGHGPIRLRDSAPPTLEADIDVDVDAELAELAEPEAAPHEAVGHGTIRLRDAAIAPAELEADEAEAAEERVPEPVVDAAEAGGAEALMPEPAGDAEGAGDVEALLPEPDGDGAIAFAEPAEPTFPDSTAMAKAHIFAALDLIGESDGDALEPVGDEAELDIVGDE